MNIMTTTRLIFVEGKSSKFWQITVEDAKTVTSYGKIGTDGVSGVKEHASSEKAEAFAAKEVAAKLKKGYSVEGAAAAQSSAPAPEEEKEPAKKTKRQPKPKAAPEPEGDDEEPEQPAKKKRQTKAKAAPEPAGDDEEPEQPARKKRQTKPKAAAAEADDEEPEQPKKKPRQTKAKAAAAEAAAPDVLITSTRLVVIEGKTSKFWQISVDGAKTTTTYGKIGSDGASSVKEHADAAKAQKFATKEIATKIKKGYSEEAKDKAAAPAPATEAAAEEGGEEDDEEGEDEEDGDDDA